MDDAKSKDIETTEKPLSIVEEAAKLRDEIRAENDRREALLREEQNLHAERMLGGTSGQPINQEKQKSPAEQMAEEITRAFK